MSGNIIQLNDKFIQSELKTLVKNSVEETLNALLDAEADKQVQAERYARDTVRHGPHMAVHMCPSPCRYNDNSAISL